jgi:uncharacterized protein
MHQVRTSSYVIYVPVGPTADGKDTLLVHGYTGAYDRVSDNVVRFLKKREAKRDKPLYGEWVKDAHADDTPEAEISSVTHDTLRRRGYLTELSVEQEEEVFKRFAGILHRKNSGYPSYIVMPTYDCNLRCSYCFQDHMRTNPLNRHLLRVMSRDMVDRMFLGMEEIERRHGVDTETFVRQFTLFGGEPLLAGSKDTISYIVEKAKKRGEANFMAISNATELDAYPELLGPEGISGLQITLDGPPDEHDKRRIYPDGKGSFEKIAQNITMALGRGASVSVRINLDRNNIRDVPRLAHVLKERGWTSHPNFSVYSAPIHAANEKTSRKTTFNSWELDQELTRMRVSDEDLVRIQRPDDRIVAAARRIFAKGPSEQLPNYKESFCSAHTGMYIFDSFGDIYACWERTGDPSIRIGHVSHDGTVTLNTPELSQWRERTVASNTVCSKCRYGLQCGGGCAVLAATANGAYNTNYCDGFASRFKASVSEAYKDHIAGRSMVMADRVCDQ